MKVYLPLTLVAGMLVFTGVASAQASPGAGAAGASDTQSAMDEGLAGTSPQQPMQAPVRSTAGDKASDPAKTVKLAARLGGSSETDKGDRDGIGVFAGRLNRAEGQLCYSMKVAKLKAPTAAKIYAAPGRAKGDVALTLEVPANGEATGCVDVDRGMADALVAAPENFYVSIQNQEFRNGAIRGRLSEG